MVVLALVKTR